MIIGISLHKTTIKFLSSFFNFYNLIVYIYISAFADVMKLSDVNFIHISVKS